MEGSESSSWDTFLGSAADCGHPSQAVEKTDLGYQTINFEAKNSEERFSYDQLDLSSFTQKFCRCALRVAWLKKLCETFLCSLLCAHRFWEEWRWWWLWPWQEGSCNVWLERHLCLLAGSHVRVPECCVTSLSLPGQRTRGALLAAFRAWASTGTA